MAESIVHVPTARDSEDRANELQMMEEKKGHLRNS